ncbi:sigma-70 family RNA polymerase sigma factor [Gemmata sp. JC717]|uniref:RNA polymerase sigma factor n=1 Tax=Gemmata algarum TaxID=2975278 RepID=UPI0021BAB47A|nr:sigma-70 family RNA polymerase sigma factor [Gemmata algarum]MDY3551261.1 sigma-70 family RNA polymerase sigma factor [Gemmata algarum]
MSVSVLHAVSRLAAPDGRTDADLLRAFLTGSDEGAFAELVRRHGPSVLGVCRRALGATPDAEDAFQATFLVLVRRAGSMSWRSSLGPWLFGVAIRVSRKVRARRSRRVSRERGEVPMVEPVAPASDPDDAGPVVDEELSGLPVRYREPLVLCEVRGLSRRAAARELGLAEGTLSSRLARGAQAAA